MSGSDNNYDEESVQFMQTETGKQFKGIPSDLLKLTNEFKQWRTNKTATDKQHDEYVKLTQDRPGRAATITDKSILGDMPKTILG